MQRVFHKNWAIAATCLLLIPTNAATSEDTDRPRDPHHESDSEPATGGKPEAAAGKPKGLFDKAIEIKGTGIKIQFGGFAKVDFIQDFDPVGNEDQFKVNSIPVEGDPDSELGGNTHLSAKQTRFSVDVRNDTKPGQVRVYIEGDFFGSGTAFRLRHGYGEWKGLLGGQTWSTFQDITARPFTLDYEGPDAEFFVRQAMIRYTGHPSETLEWSVAVEDPDSQISVTAPGVTGVGRSEFPDIPARVRIRPAWGHIQIAGMLRQLRLVSDGGVIDETTVGYGLNVSGKGKLGKRDSIMGHVGFGSGVGRYVESLGGTGSDAVFTPDGDLDALDVLAGVLGYQHGWSDRLHSTISAAVADVDNESSQPDDAIATTRSAHVNLVYAPNRLVNIGGELMWGERENKGGTDGDAFRLQVSIQYKFR